MTNLTPTLLTPEGFSDYELIDCGDFHKLERFGEHILLRPEPQAIWRSSMPHSEWEGMASALFINDKKSDDRGNWSLTDRMPDRWFIKYSYKDMTIRFRLALTSFKHVGIFPEQAVNWNFIYDKTKEKTLMGLDKPQILNLFAYTGGATLAAAAAGGVVTHVDSVKQVVSWARENMEESGLDGTRWIVDDARKFVKREVKREKRYDGIILDPPAYGRGPDGEKWILEEDLEELLTDCTTLLNPDGFMVLNLYSMGLSALLARSLVYRIFGKDGEFGELYIRTQDDTNLPLGVYCRF